MKQQLYDGVVTIKVVSFLCAVLVSIFVETDASVESLFSSLSKIKALWHNELKYIRLMEKIILEMESPPKELEAYVMSHYTHRLNQTPTYDYLGHPLNSYHLIRHIASGWNSISNSILDNEVKYGHIDAFKKLSSFNNNLLPDIDDVIGGAVSIVKLWVQYRINLMELVRNGKIVAILENGRIIKSQPSVVKINAFDLDAMVIGAQKQHLYYAAAVFSNLLVWQTKKEDTLKNINHEYLWKFNITTRKAKFILSQSQLVHDTVLEKEGPVGLFHRCNYKPFNVKLEMKKKHIHIDFRDRDTLEMYIKNKQTFPHLEDTRYIALNNYTQTLCKGGKLSTADQRANLRCYYSSSNSDWLQLGPLRFDVNSYDPFHVTIKQLVFLHECDEITLNNTHNIKPYAGKKQKFHEKIPWTASRTMQNARIREDASVVYDKVNRRIEQFTKLRSNATKDEAEELFLGDYGIGGSYSAHVDFSGSEQTGNRLATISILLDAPKAGGATIFPYAGISVFPEKGDGMIWYNVYKRGDVDTFMTHMGCPVLIGNKVIANKWIGYNAQCVSKKCGLLENATFSIPIFKAMGIDRGHM